MARGFWTGLGHGAALSAGLLAVMSVVIPMSDENNTNETPAGIASRPDEAADSADANAARPAPSETAAPPAADAPLAGAVDLPVGSEFGRGDDIAPRQPAPLAAPSARSGPRDAPAVAAPAAEPAPVAITGDNERPQTQDDPRQPAQITASGSSEGPELTRPAALDSPVLNVAPQMAISAEQDQTPETRFVFEERPAPEEPKPVAAATAPRQPAASPAVEDGAERAPAMPSPGLDLSLPPDLSDLRSLGRD
ncbi:hypothetical protein [Paracoccus seriniphilus]|uniref:Uncharacterized protein n=1 Tax=Paracoccus seriniphilus TaxID=184748 RepID=A0A239PMY0_9RHOB|nr:hypothetical protein [Paracoccus seriniphilus]WCR14915.1 hypothetical protein JHW44_05620 [Paracoccus seriniphilus]SNT71664.1 hypothetical protein SAMN05444959_102178 [Paracoccus seriniphilus]